MRARPASASAGASAARSAQRGTLELVDLLCEGDVRVGDAVSDVRREDDPNSLVGLDVDIGVMVRRIRRLSHPVDERHGSLEALEREGLGQGVAFAGPACTRGEERGERGLVQPCFVLGRRHSSEPTCTRFVRGAATCVILTTPKLCEPTWLAERPVPPVTYAKTGASAVTQASVPAHAARKGSLSCPTSSSWALRPSSRVSLAS